MTHLIRDLESSPEESMLCNAIRRSVGTHDKDWNLKNFPG